MRLTIRLVLFWLLAGAAARAQQIQLSAGYLYQGSNHAPTASNWFGGHGARAEVSFGAWRNLSIAGEFTGMHARDLGAAGQGLTLFTYTVGPRCTFPITRIEKRRVSVFVQALFGGVHASDGIFPSGTINKHTATAFALSSGGGVEMALKPRLSLRLMQADYLYTRLPNLFGNYQNSFRLGAGISYQLH